MRRDQFAFLVGGILFGVLLGFGLAWAVASRPGADPAEPTAAIPSPAGPMAATQSGLGVPASPQPPDGAPMMREINALKTALQTAPDNLAAWVRLGNIYHDASMFDQAVGFYEKAVALAPGDVNVITDLGVCLQEMGRFEEAVARFREAQAADPSHWQSLYNLVVVEGLALGRFDAAEASLARLEKTRPDAPRLAELRASLEEARKRPAAESR